ncbi:MAG: hypothetical protein A2126_01430 [Candidatus Woykebacteria bacterium GWB1_45_5]|uniref:DUF2007 domain-containing protein n=2 Tax=Candidatus Woykeibacteriota TaxID=1817899 RepID=A0A1G1W218_9BACT|nr:MAG: hypothetical protein A2113_04210 [Candidatus Woykebacteria bacterium GWA1_44_8]OGY23728.1 MAG: hypothetical protein A2126_01430 [Candidatus Woykebacteria bacterium GWB1_45_5]
MALAKKEFKEVAVYTAENNSIAQMLVEKLENLDIPARIGTESASAGVFGVPGGGRTILVPEKFVQKAKEVLEIR